MIGGPHERDSQRRIEMAPYAVNGCPSSFKPGTLEMDAIVNNETQKVIFQICVPQTAEDDLVFGLLLGSGLVIGIVSLVIIHYTIWRYWCYPRFY
jgi:hypothetical protein